MSCLVQRKQPRESPRIAACALYICLMQVSQEFFYSHEQRKGEGAKTIWGRGDGRLVSVTDGDGEADSCIFYLFLPACRFTLYRCLLHVRRGTVYTLWAVAMEWYMWTAHTVTGTQTKQHAWCFSIRTNTIADTGLQLSREMKVDGNMNE